MDTFFFHRGISPVDGYDVMHLIWMIQWALLRVRGVARILLDGSRYQPLNSITLKTHSYYSSRRQRGDSRFLSQIQHRIGWVSWELDSPFRSAFGRKWVEDSRELTDNSKINIVNKFSINLYNAQNKYQRKSYCKNRLSFTILYIECSQSHTFSTLSQKKDAKYFMVAMLLDFSCVCGSFSFAIRARAPAIIGIFDQWSR